MPIIHHRLRIEQEEIAPGMKSMTQEEVDEVSERIITYVTWMSYMTRISKDNHLDDHQIISGRVAHLLNILDHYADHNSKKIGRSECIEEHKKKQQADCRRILFAHMKQTPDFTMELINVERIDPQQIYSELYEQVYREIQRSLDPLNQWIKNLKQPRSKDKKPFTQHEIVKIVMASKDPIIIHALGMLSSEIITVLRSMNIRLLLRSMLRFTDILVGDVYENAKEILDREAGNLKCLIIQNGDILLYTEVNEALMDSRKSAIVYALRVMKVTPEALQVLALVLIEEIKIIQEKRSFEEDYNYTCLLFMSPMLRELQKRHDIPRVVDNYNLEHEFRVGKLTAGTCRNRVAIASSYLNDLKRLKKTGLLEQERFLNISTKLKFLKKLQGIKCTACTNIINLTEETVSYSKENTQRMITERQKKISELKREHTELEAKLETMKKSEPTEEVKHRNHNEMACLSRLSEIAENDHSQLAMLKTFETSMMENKELATIEQEYEKITTQLKSEQSILERLMQTKSSLKKPKGDMLLAKYRELVIISLEIDELEAQNIDTYWSMV